MHSADIRHTRDIRNSELQFLLDRLKPNSRILEIGAGSDYQASLIANHGHHIEAVDINRWGEPLYPLSLYDGRNLPFDEDYFDCVFSSNVLEHVVHLNNLEAEISRVLKPGGRAIHIVPSPVWRIWTLTYYPALQKIIFFALKDARQKQTDNSTVSSTNDSAGVDHASPSRFARYLKWLGTLCMSPRHGERGNRMTEFLYFRLSWWRSHIHQNNFEIVEQKKVGIFFPGTSCLDPDSLFNSAAAYPPSWAAAHFVLCDVRATQSDPRLS